MRTPIFKSAVLVLFLLVFITGANANTTNYSDSSKMEGGKTTGLTYFGKANVIYPALLTGHENQTLEYIERFSINRRAYVVRTFTKGKKFFPKITAIFNKYALPQEFKVLIALESGFNPNAVSPAGAVGYWQIMDPVAREYGLKIAERSVVKTKHTKKGSKKTVTVDERKNFNKSTYAAARYLKDRGRNLNNDLLLIVASYNWGVGNIWNAMQRTGMRSPTFWDIKKYLPAETRTYVMNFIALNVLFHNYDKFSKNNLTFQGDASDEADEVDDDCSAFIGPLPDAERSFK